MTASILPQERTARRVSKALGIIVRQEVIPCDDRPGFFHVSDAGTGSGKVYTASATSCTCPDATFRGNRCKHQIAAEAEERELAAYCTDWNARSEQARAALDDLPGDLLDTSLDFADVVLTESAPKGAWYKGGYYTAEQCDQAAQARAASPRCPMCGSPLVTQQYYIGGRGYVGFEVCSGDGSHPARRLS